MTETETKLTESEVRQVLEELQATFDLHWKAEQRGIKRWQEATGRKLTWPDTADFTVWLIDRLERAEEVIKVARQVGEVQIDDEGEVSEFTACALVLALHVAAYDETNARTEGTDDEQ